jgi:hypothetical protein
MLCCCASKRRSSNSRGASGSRGVPVHCMHRPPSDTWMHLSPKAYARLERTTLLTKIACEPSYSILNKKNTPMLSAICCIAQPRDCGYTCWAPCSNIVITAHGRPHYWTHLLRRYPRARVVEPNPAKTYSCQDEDVLGIKENQNCIHSRAKRDLGQNPGCTIGTRFRSWNESNHKVGGGLSGRYR